MTMTENKKEKRVLRAKAEKAKMSYAAAVNAEQVPDGGREVHSFIAPLSPPIVKEAFGTRDPNGWDIWMSHTTWMDFWKYGRDVLTPNTDKGLLQMGFLAFGEGYLTGATVRRDDSLDLKVFALEPKKPLVEFKLPEPPSPADKVAVLKSKFDELLNLLRPFGAMYAGLTMEGSSRHTITFQAGKAEEAALLKGLAPWAFVHVNPFHHIDPFMMADFVGQRERPRDRLTWLFMNQANFVDLRKWDSGRIDLESQGSLLDVGIVATLWGALIVVHEDIPVHRIGYLRKSESEQAGLFDSQGKTDMSLHVHLAVMEVLRRGQLDPI